MLRITAAGAATAPSTPTNLVAVAGDGQIILTWSKHTGRDHLQNLAFDRERQRVDLLLVNVTTNGFTNSNLANGVTYYYIISAANSAGTSPVTLPRSAPHRRALPFPCLKVSVPPDSTARSP